MSATQDALEQDMPTGLSRRGARYSIRRRIPTDLLAHYGREEISRALGTSDPKEARKLLTLAWLDLDREFEAVRESAKASDPAPVAAVVTMTPEEALAVATNRLRASREKAAETGKLQAWVQEERFNLALHQQVLDGKYPPVFPLWKHEAGRNALRIILTGEGASSVVTPGAGVASTEVSLSALVDLWVKDQERPDQTIKAMRRTVRRFELAVGARLVAKVTRQDVTAFIDKMREPGFDTPNGHTIPNANNMISILSALFGYARKRNLVEVNVFAGSKAPDRRKRREVRRPFDEAALRAVFTSPVYTAAERPDAGGGEAAYRVPLLALYTGARVNELCQLHPDDVIEEPYSGPDGRQLKAWVIRIEENKAKGQRVKNEASERRVPVHPDLEALGFIKFAQEAQASQHALVFKDLRRGLGNRVSGNWGQWFSRHLRTVCKVEDKRMVFHSFRHTFIHHARQTIPTEVRNAMVGHETGEASANYGGPSYPLHPLVEGMKTYSIPGFAMPLPPPQFR